MNKPILNILEFEKLPHLEQKQLLIEWRDSHLTNLDIARAMGIDMHRLQILIRKYNLPRKKGRRQLEREIAKREISQGQEAAVTVMRELEPPVISQKSKTKELSVVANPDIMIYFKQIPHLEVEVKRKEGYEIKAVIICKNPDTMHEVDNLIKTYQPVQADKVFGNGKMITILYKRLEV